MINFFIGIGIAGLYALSLLTSDAYSADMQVRAAPKAPAAAGPDWTGLYIGAFAGYGRSKGEGEVFATDNGGDTITRIFGVKNDSWLAGGMVGYQRQFGSAVLGVEIDAGTTGLQGVSWVATARLRGGLLLTDRALLYVTGGGVYGRLDLNVPVATDPSFTGWVVGGGIDYSLSQNFKVGIEYRHLDIGVFGPLKGTADIGLARAYVQF
jgi:outer membrane immunogenic protein